MAGVGPAPKDPSRRARRNKDPQPQTVLRFEKAEAFDLPEDIDWHPRTRDWWEMWKRSPQAEVMIESDWYYLLDTALMHHAMWSKGQWTLAAEVRLRVAAFGATPADRARLRMQFADADEKDAKRPERPKSESRYASLRVLPSRQSDEVS
ncbi:hypothetical protein ABZ917_17355 [Nonomuraea wenchangensis]